MRFLDPNDHNDFREIIMCLIEEKMETLGASEVLARIAEPLIQEETSLTESFSELGSVIELNQMLTEFHFAQQIIFDFYDIDVEWDF